MTRKTRERITHIKMELGFSEQNRHPMEWMANYFGISRSRIAALYKIANDELEAERKRYEEIMEQARKEELIAWVKKTTVTDQEADAYLSQIIRGEKLDEKVISTPKGAEVVKLATSAADVMKAIELRSRTLPPKHYVFKNGKYVTGEETEGRPPGGGAGSKTENLEEDDKGPNPGKSWKILKNINLKK